jgi:hypothetical protein
MELNNNNKIHELKTDSYVFEEVFKLKTIKLLKLDITIVNLKLMIF